MEKTCDYCTLSRRSAAEEILHQLREAPPITILAIGPTTNLALAHRQDPLTFSLAKQVFVLGGMRLGRRTWATEYCDLKIETSGEYTRGAT